MNDYQVNRPIYQREKFNDCYPEVSSPTFSEKLENEIISYKDIINKKSYKNCFCLLITNIFPCITWLTTYNVRNFLLRDIVAGFTVAFMHIPQGMAYVALIPLPPVYGLYTSFFPVIIYCIFGTSKHISIGTYAVVSIMLGNVISKYTTNDIIPLTNDALIKNYTVIVNSKSTPDLPSQTDIAVQVALSITFLVGIMQMLLGIFRIGFITTYMSTPIVRGFTTGASLHVFTSQLKSFFGLPNLPRREGIGKLMKTFIDFIKLCHTSNIPTLSLSCVCVIILISVKILMGTAASYFMNLHKYGVETVGNIPEGFPQFKIPTTQYWSANLVQSFALAMVAFFTSFSMAKILGEKHNYEIYPNKELIAYGLSTMFSSFFSSIVSSASLSRSLVQESVGGQTQITGVVSCILLLAVILKIGSIFKTLPSSVLSAIIIVALRGMFYQLKDIRFLYKRNKIDLSIFLVTLLATVFLDVDVGLALGVIYALLTLVVRTQKPKIIVLGNISGTELYVDLKKYPKAYPIDNVLIYSFQCFLYYANSNIFRDHLYKEFKKASQEQYTSIRIGIKEPNKNGNEPRRSIGKLGLDTHDMKVMDASHCSFTKSPLITHDSENKQTSANATQNSPNNATNNVKPKSGPPHNNTSYDESPGEDETSDGEAQYILTRYNSLVEDGTKGIIKSMSDRPKQKKQIVPNGADLDYKIQEEIPQSKNIRHIIIDFSYISFVDTVGIETLTQVIKDFKEVGVDIILVECNDNVMRCMERFTFLQSFPPDKIFITIHDAVLWIEDKKILR
ncbi:prestin-like isoform X2 [Gordionus sp. m RMFG-2023]|uniref:prestin-like isoform X2 n=1 Tax=Gordionus sp. m RMFG-2023 TaxID=3053472 RepID=UPI0031FCD26D